MGKLMLGAAGHIGSAWHCTGSFGMKALRCINGGVRQKKISGQRERERERKQRELHEFKERGNNIASKNCRCFDYFSSFSIAFVLLVFTTLCVWT